MLVSGFLSNIEYAWLYPSLAGFLARLASFSRLILMDRRGSGLSDRTSAPPPIETSLEDVEVVLDEVGSPKTTLFGLWDGCVTSILFAATHPERVASLVLFSSSPAQTPKEDYPWAWTESRWAEWLTSIREGWGSRAWIVRNARWMGPTMLDDPAELENWITYTRLAASPSSAETVMRNSKNTDIRQVLPVVQAPALVLHRKGDQVEAIEAGRYVASRISGARFVELDGDDGIPWLGDVEALASEIENFLAGRARRRQGERSPSRDRALHRHCRIDGASRGSRRRQVASAIARTRSHRGTSDPAPRRPEDRLGRRRGVRDLRRSCRSCPMRPGGHRGCPRARIRDQSRRPHRRGRGRRRSRPRRCRSPRRAHRRGGKSLAGAGVIDSARPYRGEWPHLRGRRRAPTEGV